MYRATWDQGGRRTHLWSVCDVKPIQFKRPKWRCGFRICINWISIGQVHVSKKGRELGLVLFVSTANRLHSGLVISMLLSCTWGFFEMGRFLETNFYRFPTELAWVYGLRIGLCHALRVKDDALVSVTAATNPRKSCKQTQSLYIVTLSFLKIYTCSASFAFPFPVTLYIAIDWKAVRWCWE